jgi:hypothetical protein
VARRIKIIKAPFDYRWPGVSAITHFSTAQLDTEQLVKDELADWAIEKGYAVEASSKKAPAKKAKTKAAAADKVATDGGSSNIQPDDRLDDASLAEDGGAANGDSIVADAS